MRNTSLNKIADLQRQPKHIRNICILAHVDHGKTSLADTLVASNGIISQRMAGKLRYLDSREDEQIRGITMKSSAISLHFTHNNEDHLINLIDSPGHIDFSSEVSTAVRLCDGAIVVIDVVEGVSPQTHAVLRQAWLEGIQPVLVLNKLDRLITEWKMSPLEAHLHLQQILEQVNAITGELFTSDVLEKTSTKTPKQPSDSNSEGEQVFDWSAGLEETDDSSLYFSPDQGNVVFGSALDGWGFGIIHFAEMFAAKLGLNAEVLRKTLWGDFYLEGKTKRIKKGAQAKAKKPLFVQVVLENLWAVYDAVIIRRDKDRTEKIVKSLNLKIPPRDARHNDPRVQLQAICSQWLPLSEAVLTMVVDCLPSPLEMSGERVEKLLCSRARRFDSLPVPTQQLKHNFLACSSGDDAPVVLFVSKMFAMDKKALPKNRQRPLTQQEIAERREQARQRHANRLADMKDKVGSEEASSNVANGIAIDYKPTEDTCSSQLQNAEGSDIDQVFIAFARVFSGTVKKGQRLYVLGPKHDPAKALESSEGVDISPDLTVGDLSGGCHITSFQVNDLFLFMGRELEYMEEVPAGNVLGIGGLEDHVLKSATIASTVACPTFTDMYFEAAPIVRVAVEPKHAADLRKLMRGMKLLNQADPSVQVLVQETGEHVLIAAGEVHLQKCIDDLTERFAKIEVSVSSPIVPFRETIVPPPKIDMVNEIIEEQNQLVKSKVRDPEKEEDDEDDEEVMGEGVVQIRTPNLLGIIQVKAIPLPDDVTKLLEENSDLIKTLEQYSTAKMAQKSDLQIGFKMNPETRSALLELKGKLNEAFKEAGDEWEGSVGQIWSFGPRRNGPNILLNRIEEYHRPSIWGAVEKDVSEHKKKLWDFDSSIMSGFQLATLSGPLCEEPMRGVCFAVELWDMLDGSRNRTISSASSASLTDEIDMNLELVNCQDVGMNCSEENSDVVISDQQTVESDYSCDATVDSSHSKASAKDLCEKVGQLSVKFADNVTESKPTSSSSSHWSSQKRPVGGPLSGQLMSCMKEACRRSFQTRCQRLMTAMYTCVIQATADVLGKLYAVLGKRNGRVLSEELREGSSVFDITSVLPVIESFGFAEEIRKRTSGLASPQLQFSHWEVVDMDPFWVPTTEEEYMHFGEKADSQNRARKYKNNVRKRKGLKVDEKLVEFAEKQRTLSKNV